MNDVTKEENICPKCEKPLTVELFDIDSKQEECWCCYECGLICSPFNIYKVIKND